MSMDQNLMGLGLPAPLAARIATGGTGPVSVAAGGNYTIAGKQFLVYVTSGTRVTLPPVGGDMGPEVADDFVIHNAAGAGLSVTPVSGVTVNIQGVGYTSASAFTIANLHTLTLWVQSSTQWFGVYS